MIALIDILMEKKDQIGRQASVGFTVLRIVESKSRVLLSQVLSCQSK